MFFLLLSILLDITVFLLLSTWLPTLLLLFFGVMALSYFVTIFATYHFVRFLLTLCLDISR